MKRDTFTQPAASEDAGNSPSQANLRATALNAARISIAEFAKLGIGITPEATRILRSWIERAALQEQHLLGILSEMVQDGECYCADHVVAIGSCAWCKASALLKLRTISDKAQQEAEQILS